MEAKPMIITAKHSITIKPPIIDLALAHARFFIYDRQTKLEQALRDRGSYRVQQPTVDPVLTLQREIKQSEALLQQLEPVQGEILRYYELHFKVFADVLRNTRIHLGQANIENMYSLKVAVAFATKELKAMNESFSTEKFLNYINAER